MRRGTSTKKKKSTGMQLLIFNSCLSGKGPEGARLEGHQSNFFNQSIDLSVAVCYSTSGGGIGYVEYVDNLNDENPTDRGGNPL